MDRRNGVRREPAQTPARVFLEAIEHVLREQFDVLATRPQRRLVDLQHAQPVIQVGAETAFDHRRLHVDVRRGNDPHIDGRRAVAAQPLDLALLKETQQARLAFERQIADFIEEQRAAIGRFHAADLALVRAR